MWFCSWEKIYQPWLSRCRLLLRGSIGRNAFGPVRRYISVYHSSVEDCWVKNDLVIASLAFLSWRQTFSDPTSLHPLTKVYADLPEMSNSPSINLFLSDKKLKETQKGGPEILFPGCILQFFQWNAEAFIGWPREIIFSIMSWVCPEASQREAWNTFWGRFQRGILLL